MGNAIKTKGVFQISHAIGKLACKSKNNSQSTVLNSVIILQDASKTPIQFNFPPSLRLFHLSWAGLQK